MMWFVKAAKPRAGSGGVRLAWCFEDGPSACEAASVLRLKGWRVGMEGVDGIGGIADLVAMYKEVLARL